MVLTILLILIVVVLFSFHFYVRYRREGRCASNVPGPKPYPFVGNMLDFDISDQTKIWTTVRNVSNTWYPITRVWMTAQALFSIRHPDDLEIILTSQTAQEKGWTYNYLHPWLRQGLLTSKGTKWHQRRKILTPSFHFNILEKYMEITHEQADSIVKYLRSKGTETVENLMPFCSKFTLNVICEAAMGVALDKMDPKEITKYKEAIYTVGSIAIYRMPRPYIMDWMLKITPFLKINRDHKAALSTLHSFTSKVVKDRKEYHEKTSYKYLEDITGNVDVTEDDIYMARKKRLAMLDLLISAEKDGLIDEEGIKEEVDTFTFEGHDTTAMAMTFILLLLAENKECQDKAREEVTKILDGNGRQLGMKEVQELHYVERCIKEALRLYPPVTTIFRYLSEDLQLKHAFIPGGSTAIIHFYDLHRDEHFWPEPEKYDPDRFLAENSKNRHAFAYLPFSAGSRNCIGQKFALLELKALIGNILYNFHVEPVDKLENVKLIADLVLRPSEPVHVKFIQVEKKL